MQAVDLIIEKIGRTASYLIFFMSLLTTFIVIARYGFNWSNIALQELVSYFHALTFMLVIPWALNTDDHVRVDIFYRRLSSQPKAWINLIGAIVCLLPFSLFTFTNSLDFVFNSWSILEDSPQANGIPAVFLLKSLIPISFFLLALQGISIAWRNLRTLLEGQR